MSCSRSLLLLFLNATTIIINNQQQNVLQIVRLTRTDSPNFAFDLSEPLNETAREWHFPMVNDRDRNDAYNQVPSEWQCLFHYV